MGAGEGVVKAAISMGGFFKMSSAASGNKGYASRSRGQQDAASVEQKTGNAGRRHAISTAPELDKPVESQDALEPEQFQFTDDEPVNKPEAETRFSEPNSPYKPCPCGQIPTQLKSAPSGAAGRAWVHGGCCGWAQQFDHPVLFCGRKRFLALRDNVWNEAPRS